VKNAIPLTCVALALAGCSATSDTAATPPSFDAPTVTAAGTSPISPSKQPMFCQDQVANMYDADPQNVVTNERVVATDGSTTIDVTVDKGNGDVKTFKCRLDASNRFIDVMALTSDGAL
jgi:hypothetical protein